jgi:hypothetical protein
VHRQRMIAPIRSRSGFQIIVIPDSEALLRLDDGAHPRYAARPMTVTDVEIGHARPARSPDTKAAINYLVASGATAITITEIDGVCSFTSGHKIDPHAVSVQWLLESEARALLKLARKHAGKSPDVATAMQALKQAAADQRTTLTPHAAAISRAGDAAGRIDRYMESLRGTGVLKEFNRAYKKRRMAAATRGEGFMTYNVAEARLRLALIPLLVGGRNVGPVQSLFAEIFDR